MRTDYKTREGENEHTRKQTHQTSSPPSLSPKKSRWRINPQPLPFSLLSLSLSLFVPFLFVVKIKIEEEESSSYPYFDSLLLLLL
jgi:hypothetical protein